jgi:hypothetical protein
MKSEITHIQTRLSVEGQKTIAFFAGLTTADWDQEVYATGSCWRVKQLLAHFISAERAYQRYIKDVLSGGTGAPKDLDIDAFNESETPAISIAPVEKLIAGFSQTREETLKLTASLLDADLRRMGFHPWFGDKELSWYLKLLYRHNLMHLQDIRKALEKGQATGHIQTDSKKGAHQDR